MRILLTFWCFMYSVRLIQSEKCIAKYFKILHGRRRVSTPIEKISTQSITGCAVKCMQEESCQAINFIHNGTLQYCELFDEVKVNSGQIKDDELSIYYYAIKVEGS